MKFLITAGPTREFIDDVRFISNPSSGLVGIVCAEEAKKNGHKVSLIIGPTELKPAKGIKTIRVTSAVDMLKATMKEFRQSDCLIMTAAVSDQMPRKRFSGKIKKGAIKSIILKETPDILRSIARTKRGRFIIGFALEVENEVQNAFKKLCEKSLDLIVLNGPSSFGSKYINATLIHSDNRKEHLGKITKRMLAKKIVKLAEIAQKT